MRAIAVVVLLWPCLAAEVAPAVFPADREISRSAVLPVPLLTVETGDTLRSTSENRDLAAALATKARTPDTEDVSALVRFLDRYPRSRWRPALLGNLGLHWRRTGRFQKGIDAFEEAWSLARRGKGVHAETVASWAAGETCSYWPSRTGGEPSPGDARSPDTGRGHRTSYGCQGGFASQSAGTGERGPLRSDGGGKPAPCERQVRVQRRVRQRRGWNGGSRRFAPWPIASVTVSSRNVES